MPITTARITASTSWGDVLWALRFLVIQPPGPGERVQNPQFHLPLVISSAIRRASEPMSFPL
jgi:hypothetical protein